MKNKYQQAVNEIVNIVKDAMKDGHSKEDAIAQAIEGLEEDVRFKLAQQKVS